MINIENNLNEIEPVNNRNSKLRWVLFGALILTGFVLYNFVFSLPGREIEIAGQNTSWLGHLANIFPFGRSITIDGGNWEDNEYVMPDEEKDRLDVLILGLRGKDDLENGGMLTDTMMLFSYNKITGKASLVSIPRDLYVKISPSIKDKLNSAYERLGPGGMKKLFSKLTGVYVDNYVAIDFDSFKNVVEALGGIDITLDQPFRETQQWGYEFYLPAGTSHLNGEQALYYARSRYLSSDFDRAQRQQKIIFAVKKKAIETNYLADPLKALEMMSLIRQNVKTDFNLKDVTGLISLAGHVSGSTEKMKREVLTTENLLYETKINNLYVLLPKGDSLDILKAYFKNVLN